jgi:hypothetical protein
MTPEEEKAYIMAQLDKDRYSVPDTMGPTATQEQPVIPDSQPFQKLQMENQFQNRLDVGSDVSRDPSSVKSKPLPRLRNPISGPPTPVDENPVIKNEPINLEANMPQDDRDSSFISTAENKTPQEIRESKNTDLASQNFMVGASHALLGLLSGSPTGKVMNYGAGDEFLKNQQARQDQLNNSKNLVMITDANGKPVYTQAQNAEGENPYIKPLKLSSVGLPVKASFVDPKNPGVIIQGSFNRLNPPGQQYLDGDGKIVTGAQAPNPVNMQEGITAGGSKVVTPYNRLLGTPTGPKSTISTGEADLSGQGTKKFEQGMKISEDVQNQRLPLQAKRADINTSMGLLNSGSSTTQLIGVGNTLKNLAQQGLNDKSAQMYAPPGLFQRVQDAAQALISGNINPDKINEAKQVLIEMNQSIDEQDKALTGGATQAFAGNNQKSKKYIEPFVSQSKKEPVQAPAKTTTPVVNATDHQDASEAIRWANAHTSDPRAKEIYRRFGR